MKNNIRSIRPTTNWITTVILTLFVATFGIFAQSHASERGDSFQNDLPTLLASACDNQTSHSKQQTPALNY